MLCIAISWYNTVDEIVAIPPEMTGYYRTNTVGGEYNQWFNITGTGILAGAEDPSFGDYICSVCVDRGTPSEECHNATTTLHILGAPPVLDRAVDNGEAFLCLAFSSCVMSTVVI